MTSTENFVRAVTSIYHRLGPENVGARSFVEEFINDGGSPTSINPTRVSRTVSALSPRDPGETVIFKNVQHKTVYNSSRTLRLLTRFGVHKSREPGRFYSTRREAIRSVFYSLLFFFPPESKHTNLERHLYSECRPMIF